MTTSDHGVAATAMDAAVCKESMIAREYSVDEYIGTFVKQKARRLPLINRGYALRALAMEQILNLFLTQPASSVGTIQILSLGAGFDTLYWRKLQHLKSVRYFEVDQLEIVQQKHKIIDAASLPWPSAQCHLISCDLGNPTLLQQTLVQNGFDPQLPTFILSECVLVYLQHERMTQLLDFLATWVQNATIAVYEPMVASSGTYSETMKHYFGKKGCSLRSLMGSNGWLDQFIASGWKRAIVTDMNGIWKGILDENERERWRGLEPFDELEDFVLHNAHYGVLVASNKFLNRNATVVSKWQDRLTEDNIVTSAEQYAEITIRRVRPSDFERVCRVFETTHLEYQSTSSAVAKFVRKSIQSDRHAVSCLNVSLTQPDTALWVAIVDGEVQGCVAARPRSSQTQAELVRLSVMPEYRRKGIGALLIQTVESFCVRLGYTRMSIDTLSTMQAAQRLYVNSGYSLGEKKTVGNSKSNGFTIFVYSKLLSC